MYNEELKKEFIEQYTDKPSVKMACIGVFKAFKKYENKYGSDLCAMSTEQLQPIVSELLGVRVSGHYLIMSILRSYVRWCIDNNIHEACDGIFDVKDDNSEKIRTQMVSSPLHLQKYLDALYNNEEEHTVDDTFRCFFWLAFGGLEEKSILNVMDSDIDFEEMVARADDGREYPIYREGIKAFKNCVKLTHFVYKHPNYSKDILRERLPGHQLIRGVRGEPTMAYVRAQISEKAKKAKSKNRTDTCLSYYRTWLSGMFYRIYQFELAGFEPDFNEMAQKFVEGKTYKSGSKSNTIEARYRKAIKDYNEDYERWKVAFIK